MFMDKTIYAKRSFYTAAVMLLCFMMASGFATDEVYAAAPKPSKVTISNVKALDSNSISIKWKKAARASKYQIYRSTSYNGKYKLIKTTRSLRYTNTGLTASKRYYYKIRGVNGSRKGSFSARKYAKTLPKEDSDTSDSDTSDSDASDLDSTDTADLDYITSTMLQLINDERESAGLKPLKISSPINYTAQKKAEDMYKEKVLDHYSENLGWFYDQFKAAGIKYDGGGENIARGYQTVEGVMRGWMNSPGHKKNILSSDWTHVGIGFCNGYWVQQFAKNPRGGYDVCCPTGMHVNCVKCGKDNLIKEYSLYSTDAEGNSYGITYCSGCGKRIGKCPKCETGCFAPAGISENGSTASRCNSCGNMLTKICIENCAFCGDKLVGNIDSVKYRIAFDSTGTYDGNSYQKKAGCYFQHYALSIYRCKSCHKPNTIAEFDRNNYLDFYNKLKSTLPANENIYDYIVWEKEIGYDLIREEGNEKTYRIRYEFVETPEITDLAELIGVAVQ